MKRAFTPRQIALSGILTALSVIFFFLSYYFNVMATTFNVALSLVVLVGFCTGGYPVAILIYGATAMLGVLFTNIVYAIPYLVLFGIAPVISVLVSDKVGSVVLAYLIRVLYFSAVVAVVYFFADVITGEWLRSVIAKGVGYTILLGIAAVLVLILYDKGLRYARPHLDRLVKRITRHG